MQKIKTFRVWMLSALVLATALLSGCGGSDNAYVGKWSMSGGKANGVAVTQEQIQQMMPSMDMSLTFNQDGTCQMVVMDQTYEGTYQVTKDGVTVKDATSEQTFVKQDDKLVLSQGNIEIYLVKQNA